MMDTITMYFGWRLDQYVKAGGRDAIQKWAGMLAGKRDDGEWLIYIKHLWYQTHAYAPGESPLVDQDGKALI